MINLDLKQYFEESEDGAVLLIEGDATLEHAAEMKQALQALFATAGQLSIDCEKITSVDLSGLQLLYSVRQTASAQSRRLSFDVSLLPVFQQARLDSGFPHGWMASAGELPNTVPGQEAAEC